MSALNLSVMGSFVPESQEYDAKTMLEHINSIRRPLFIVLDRKNNRLITSLTGIPKMGDLSGEYHLLGILPPIHPEWLGDRSFTELHKVRFAYVVGAMYRGITSPNIVINMAKANMLSFYGAAGQSLQVVERDLGIIADSVGKLPWGSNLIFSPAEPELEEKLVDLYLKMGLRNMSAAAFMRLTPSVVRFACKGLKVDQRGYIIRQNYVFAKISHPDMAKLFMSPPPGDIIEHLLSKGLITTEEATLSLKLPVSEDVTIEADSGGHTDNRPFISLIPTFLSIRDRMMAQYKYIRKIRIGGAGGISTPNAAAAAFAMGAAYVLTGSINQATIESGTSDIARKMLSLADITDVAMAPAADMFEMGVKVQVLKRGTMFSGKAAHLYNIYTSYNSIEDIPFDIRQKMEKELFRKSLNDVWVQTEEYFKARNMKILDKAYKEPKYKMALIFRWYLGMAGDWAIKGETDRVVDYQIQCGPSMGAFNEWVKGSYLEKPENRKVVDIALNILEGAATVSRASSLRQYGVNVPNVAFNFRPRLIKLG